LQQLLIAKIRPLDTVLMARLPLDTSS